MPRPRAPHDPDDPRTRQDVPMPLFDRPEAPRATSVAAYRQIEAEGLLSKSRLEVYRVLAEAGRPMTGSEISEELDGAIVNNVRTRLTELRDRGVVREAGTGICPVSEREVILWEYAPGALPTDPPRPSPPTGVDLQRQDERIELRRLRGFVQAVRDADEEQSDWELFGQRVLEALEALGDLA